MNRFLSRIIPFLIFGFCFVIFILGLILSLYILIAGALVGLIAFTVVWIKEKLFPSKRLTHYEKRHSPIQRKGRTIDHE